MAGKQRTLFQTWGSSVAPDTRRPPEPLPRKPRAKGARQGKRSGHPKPPPPTWQQQQQQAEEEEEEDDDDVLLVAVYEAEKTFNATITHPDHEEGGCPDLPAAPSATHIQNLPGFDLSAGRVWIYPTNYPVRQYQFTMAQAALLDNTLVCLPTGLGKTFIAAVVMYNFYRWYPSGKIVFMAPTKPLVAQQIEACFRVMGIPQAHMVEMTGTTNAQNRKEMWHNHRVFFLTPQVMVNDLTRGACAACDVKCLVIDEAHKALGNHAYCQVVRELCNYTRQFRILALSATPGSDTKAVQQVVTNLLIGQIELRSEDSPDIQQYSHHRQLEKFVVPLGSELEAVQKAYILVLEAFAGRLIQNNVLTRREIPSLTKYQIILARDQFRKNPPSNIVGIQMGAVEGDFALCISLYHGYELLLQMGTRSLFYYLRSIMDGSKGVTRVRNELGRNAEFMDLYQQLESMFSTPNGADVKKPFIYSHPKLKKLEEVVLQHFRSWNKQGQNSSCLTPEDTRIMIFSSFRDSVQEIAEMLDQHQPTVRVMTFVGHSSTGKGVKGFTQKEQLEVVKRFREGGYNTLVSTCVGEEGLDIGEVDLIICFDAQKSPIRLVQRMGRTGRKRRGQIVVILCQGREERTYNQSQSNKRSIYKAITGNNTVFHLNHEAPRMVPNGLNPTVHKMYITQGTYDGKDNAKPISKDRRSNSINRRSSVFFNGEDPYKEDQLLKPAEYETWNRLYRLTESDGVTNVVLPKTQFELFKDPDTTTENIPENTRELSLSEWKLWQNQPFPTHTVDHSIRCNNFIAVMDLIEQMRDEEGCSYAEELSPFLNKADVHPMRKPPQDIPTSKPPKKSHALNKTKTCKNSTLLSMPDVDEDFQGSTSKTAKKTKPKIEPENVEIVGVEEMDCVPDSCQQVDMDNDSVDIMEIEDTEKIEPIVKDCNETNTTLKSPPKVDSGYHSFNEDTTDILSDVFYMPHAPKKHTVCEFAEKSIYVLNHMMSRVKTFLTLSPPPTSELDLLEDVDNIRDYLTIKSLSHKNSNNDLCKPSLFHARGSEKQRKPSVDIYLDENRLENEAPLDELEHEATHEGIEEESACDGLEEELTLDGLDEQSVCDRLASEAVFDGLEEESSHEMLEVEGSFDVTEENDEHVNTEIQGSLHDEDGLPVEAGQKGRCDETTLEGLHDEATREGLHDEETPEGHKTNHEGFDNEINQEGPGEESSHKGPISKHNDSHWDDIFDCDGEETYIENFDPPTIPDCTLLQNNAKESSKKYALPKTSPIRNKEANTEEIMNSLLTQSPVFKKEKAKSEDTDIDVLRTYSPPRHSDKVEHNLELGETGLESFPEDSFDLFDDEAFEGIAQPGSSKISHHNNGANVNFNMFDPSLLMDDHTELEPGNEANLAHEKDLPHSEGEDELGSCELFSVNFELGFSLEEEDQLEGVSEDVDHLKGVTEDVDHLKGVTEDVDHLEGVTEDVDHLEGVTEDVDHLEGVTEDVDHLEGVTEDVDHFEGVTDDVDHFEGVTEDVEHKKECVEKALSPLKGSISGVGVMSTPVATGAVKSAFVNISEDQISLFSPLHPVTDKFLKTPEKSLGSSSFFTPVKETFKRPLIIDSPASNVKRTSAELGKDSRSITIGSSPESEEDVVFRRKRKLPAAAVLKSPETSSDFDSPMPVAKKRRHALNTVDSDDDDDDDDDLRPPTVAPKAAKPDKGVQRDKGRSKLKKRKHAARQFLDEEAELSSDEAEFVSSDESGGSENEQDTSLVGFFNDNTQLSQGLNDSEMHGVYLKSVRSPSVGNKFKMVQKRYSMSVFSQIPEQDESYMEDSFCVQEEEEEEEEEENEGSSSAEEVDIDLDLLQQDSFIGGRRQYCTRRRLRLRGARSDQTNPGQPAKKKRRIIIHNDSSEEEEAPPSVQPPSKVISPPSKVRNDVPSAKPLPGKSFVQKESGLTKKNVFDIPLKDRCQMRINAQASLSEELDFRTESPAVQRAAGSRISNGPSEKLETSCMTSSNTTWTAASPMNESSMVKTPGSAAGSTPLCILADCREISSGPEVISCLRTAHRVRVEICSLGGCDYIVSNRLAVERRSQTEFSNCANKTKLVERIQHLQAMFDRVCLIVEKDRVKPGETSRLLPRTKYYDSTISALISAGVQILFSSTQEETAALLKELASLESRKSMGITVPTQVTSSKQDALNFYLSIPNLSYITALNLCQQFSSVRHMTSSSVNDISQKGGVSRQKAEEIYRYLHYPFDPQMLKAGERRGHNL